MTALAARNNASEALDIVKALVAKATTFDHPLTGALSPQAIAKLVEAQATLMTAIRTIEQDNGWC